MNNKEGFTKWVLQNLTKGSGAGPAYVSSLEWLSEKFYKIGRINQPSIFNIEDVKKIDELHKETREIQRDKTSFIYNAAAPSYGDRYFYSASLSKYKDFLKDKNNIEITTKEFELGEFLVSIKESGLIFFPQLIQRFVASLCTKPFVILTGLSGSGKTKLALAFVQWICENNSQYKIIPVGADWTNREPLLGYPNGLTSDSYVTPDSGALQLIIEASNEGNSNRPYFLILDEMNLSHVERYFADFLSIMESGDSIKLYSGAKRKDADGEITPEILWPKNLFIIGTVNIDETTYMFSPKVLDRANTIEFRLNENDLQQYMDSELPLNMELLMSQGATMAESFMQMAREESGKNLKNAEESLKEFFIELKKSGAEFGYRTAGEIGRLMFMLEKLGEAGDNLLDIAIMQKLLPKLHGSRNKLSKVLPVLGGFCLINKSEVKEGYLDKFASNIKTEADLKTDNNVKYKLSFEKICRMYKNAIDNGFASYAEA